jgi:hypothetical protein
VHMLGDDSLPARSAKSHGLKNWPAEFGEGVLKAFYFLLASTLFAGRWMP